MRQHASITASDWLDAHNIRKAATTASQADAASASLELAIAMTKGWKAQPRVPSGPKGGQWTAGGGFGAGPALVAPHLGIDGKAKQRIEAAEEQSAFVKPLTDAEITGEPAYLGNPHGFILQSPTPPSPVASNGNPDDVATYTAFADPGEGLNGVAFSDWDGPPGGDWTKVDGTGDFDEPPMPSTGGKRLGAGVLIEEPDGRVWTIEPLNHFGGYQETFPKGGIEPGLTLRQTAIKEAFEESGLKVELTGVVADVERTTSVARFYRARRVGGNPSKFHWETQSVNLVPLTELPDRVLHHADKPLLAALDGGSPAVRKMWSTWADLMDSGLIPQDDVTKAKGKAGAWSKQLRVPAGLPTGGQWTTYGGGAYGSAFAAGGKPLALQMHGGTGPQSEMLNAKIAAMQAAANKGIVTKEMQKLVAKDQPAQTYSAAAWQSAKEAVAYIETAQKDQALPASVPGGSGTIPASTSSGGAMGPKGTLGDPFLLADMQKTGSKPGGSAAGAVYTDQSGQQWLVKSYDTPEQAMNEVAAAKLYNLLGVATPDMRLIQLGDAHKGGIGVASKMLTDVKPFDPQNPAHVKAAQADFGAHALLANWDAVGLSFDNLMINADGKAVMIDPGGSLFYRAQGTPKGALFGDTVGEVDTLRDPKMNPTAAKVFGPMTQSELATSMLNAAESMQHTLNSTMIGEVLGYTKGGKGLDALVPKLKARTADLKAKAEALEADMASTTALKIENTGTAKATPDHPDPGIKQLLGEGDQYVADFKAASAGVMAASAAALSGNSAEFYKAEFGKLQAMAEAGDIDGLTAAYYVPKSQKAKLSPNYGEYQKFHTAAVLQAKAVTAEKLKANPSPGDGGLVTGAAKITPADVAGFKQATASKTPVPDMTSTELGELAAAAESPMPKLASEPVLATPPPLPGKPKLASLANPNVKLNKQVDEIEAIAKQGGADAAAKVQAIAAQISGSNTYSKKAKAYAADVVAALGGQAAIDTMPAAAKKAAFDAGIAQGNVVIKQYGSIKIEEIERVVKFNPDAIPEPPNFANWNGPGQGLSSKAEINLDNDQKATAMFAAAKNNDLTKLQGIDPGPSKHTAQYKAKLVTMLGEVGTVVKKQKFVGDDGGSGDPAQFAKSLGEAFKAKQNWDPDAKKFHSFVIAGETDPAIAKATFDGIAGFSIDTGSKIAGELLDKTHATASKAAISAMKNHVTGNWSLVNHELRDGIKGSESHTKALKRAQDFEKGIYELPVGLTVSRKISGVGSFTDWQKMQGKIITEPGITSTSISPGVWSGSVYLKLKMGAGVKGAYIGPASQAKGATISGIPSEHELTLPRNTKWYIANVKKGGDDDFFKSTSSSATIVEIVVLPNDPAAD